MTTISWCERRPHGGTHTAALDHRDTDVWRSSPFSRTRKAQLPTLSAGSGQSAYRSQRRTGTRETQDRRQKGIQRLLRQSRIPAETDALPAVRWTRLFGAWTISTWRTRRRCSEGTSTRLISVLQSRGSSTIPHFYWMVAESPTAHKSYRIVAALLTRFVETVSNWSLAARGF